MIPTPTPGRRGRGRLFLAAALALALPIMARAQSLTFGSLSGRVVDMDGRGVGDAEVRIVDRASGGERFLMTDRDGRFAFGLLPVARYDVRAEALGYRPAVHLDIAVDAGGMVVLELALREQAPPVTTVDTVPSRGSTRRPRSWLVERGYADLAGGRRVASDLVSLSPIADADGVEGLPWRFADAVIDGARTGGLLAPASNGWESTGLALPLRALSDGHVGGLGYDVELGGTGVGLAVSSARGGSGAAVRAIIDGGSAGMGGALIAQGALQRDTAHAIVGVDYQRAEIAAPAWLPTSEAEALAIATAAEAHGSGLAPYTRATPRLEERASAFSRFDWLQGERFALSFRASASRFASADPPLDGPSWAGLGSRYEATAGQLGFDMYARLTRRLSAEVRVSGDVGEYGSDVAALPATTFASRNLTIGGGSADPFTDSRATPRVSGILHGHFGAHRVKLGAMTSSSVFESRSAGSALGRFRFGDAADFAAAEGAWRQVASPASVGSFRMSETAFFLQDSWRASDAISVQAGFRVEGQRVPLDRVRVAPAWTAASGLATGAFEQPSYLFSPRVAFRWELGDAREWAIEGGAGSFRALPDRRDVGELLAMAAGADVREGAGSLGGWPAAPSAAVAPVVGRAMSLGGPRFEGPRTRRLSLGLQRTLGVWTGYVSATYRHTDLLARRRDLNLASVSAGEDQYGRPLFGTLTQVGALLTAAPGSNRRFVGFDQVTAIEVGGASDHRAVTLGIDRAVDRGLSLSASYTYARTQDNLAGLTASSLDPFPAGLAGEDWTDGRSDLDVPHRALIAAEWSPVAEGAIRIGALMHLRSGAPFTARFRDGVDANADGDWTNDPAFVDTSLPGMDALLAEWECLRSDAGRFATRNECRAGWRYRLDVRAAVRLFTLGTDDVTLLLDAINVLGQATGRIDDALYIVDRAGAVTTDPGTGVTSVPLVVNPGFGDIIADRSPGMLWRVGVRIGR